MRIKHLSALSLLIVSGLIISSCAVNQKVEKQLLGKWKPVSAENLDPAASQGPTMTTITVDTSSDPEVRKESKLTMPAVPNDKEQKVQRAIANEMRSDILISKTDNNKRVIEKYFSGKTLSGTWKLKKNGKKITMKENETGRSWTADILSLTDSTLIVQDKLSFADLRIKYEKLK
jgi:hypothetical protein